MDQKKILIVEDDLVMQKVMARRFAEYPVKLFLATTSQEAVKLFVQESVDLVLLDGNLGKDSELSGLDLIPVFLRKRRGAFIIAMSANPEMRGKMLGQGADMQVEKQQAVSAAVGILALDKRTAPM